MIKFCLSVITLAYPNSGYNIHNCVIYRYLDWMNILSYDFHSAFEPAVNHHAPLYALEEDNEYNYDGELNIVSKSYPTFIESQI